MGRKKKIFASYKFFLYTLAGSVFFLISIIVMAIIANTTSIVELDNYYFNAYLQKWLWVGMFLSFAIKVLCGHFILGCQMLMLKPQQ